MEPPNPIPEVIFLSEIDDSLRVRKDYGDLGGLKWSIGEYGLIQPLVITWDENRWLLLVGGRRYRALKEMGRSSVIHGKEVLTREELYDSSDVEIQAKRAAIELEENLKRKDMSWSEQIEGKRRLKELLDQIHGTRAAGGLTRAEKSGETSIEQTGSSLRKVASILGESPATLSQDIRLAEFLKIAPMLAQAESKTMAFTKAKDALKAYQAKMSGVLPELPKISFRVLVFVDDEAAQAALIQTLEAQGYTCQPVIV